MRVIPSATSVDLSWTQSSNQTSYRISLTRITGVENGQVLCDDVAHERSPITTSSLSQNISNLEEFSTYTVTIMAIGIPGFAGNFTTNFTTLSAGTITHS